MEAYYSGILPRQTLHSLVVDRYHGRVGEQVCGPSAAVGAAHRLGAGGRVGRLHVHHLVAVVLRSLLKEASAVR